MVLFDIGAHFGLFSLAALHYGGPRAIAVAVDPSPTATRIVKIQAGLNNVSERLHVMKASAGDHTGAQSMVAVGIMASGYFVSPTKDHTENELTITKSITVDDLVRHYRLKPTHIKIDVEGGEAAVLRGARQTLSSEDAPLLFVELHNQIVTDRGGDPREPLNLLRSYGYNLIDDEDRTVNDGDLLEKEIVRVVARKTGCTN
jgi:FkbM family methyltransferase